MRANVLLLVVDALRADRCWGAKRSCQTPTLDALRRESTVFTRAFSTASMTTCCMSSILTGTYPFVHGVRSLADQRLRSDLPTLGEVFKANGYYTWAEVTGPLEPVTGVNRGFDDYHRRDHTDWLDTSWGEELFQRLDQGIPEPWFGFLHLWEIHNPRRVTPAYDSPEFGQNLYDRAVSSLDNQLAHLLDVIPDNTIIILTGDHGEYVSSSQGGDLVGRLKRPFKWLKKRVPVLKKLRRISPLLFENMDRFGQRDNDIYYNWLGHGFHVYDYLVHVPLIVRRKELFPSGTEVSEPVSHVDIFLTLISALQFQATDTVAVNGVDLMPLVRGEQTELERRHLYVEASGGRTTPRPEQWLAGLRTERYKYVRGLFNEDLPEELYDLQQDPQERENVIDRRPEVAAQLRTHLTDLLESVDAGPSEDADYSFEELEELQQRLRSLGYME